MNTKSVRERAKLRTNKNSQNLKCARELIKIQPHIMAEDRKAAVNDFQISYVTVSRYLNGQVSNLVLGMDLLNFFIKRIRQRSEDLLSLSTGKPVD